MMWIIISFYYNNQYKHMFVVHKKEKEELYDTLLNLFM